MLILEGHIRATREIRVTEVVSGARSAEILLVEDNEGDIVLATQVIEDSHVDVTVHVARDGIEAMAFLRREGRHASAPRPSVILLDLNLPRLHGIEVLDRVKGDPDLRKIPVVMFTSSEDASDIETSYQHHANSYITKPSDLQSYVEAINQLEEYWLEVVSLPGEEVQPRSV